MTGLRVLDDFRSALHQREIRWLRASVILYFALLPFNAFGISLGRSWPIVGPIVKYTELTMVLVLTLTALAFARGHLPIRRAGWLYAFLALHAAAQFSSLLAAHNIAAGLTLAVAVARYSILVFVLVNVVRSASFLRAILTTMGASCLVIVGIVSVQYLSVGGAISSDRIAAVVGSATSHVLAYALVLFGSGIVYTFLRARLPRRIDLALLITIAAWMQLITIAYVKIATLAVVAFLGLLVVTVRAQRWKAFLLLAIFALTLGYRFNVVAIHRGIAQHRARFAERALEANAARTARKAPIRSEAVAEGFAVWMRVPLAFKERAWMAPWYPIAEAIAITPAISGITPSPPAISGITPSPPAISGITPSPPAISGITPSPPAISGITPSPPAISGITPSPPAISGITQTVAVSSEYSGASRARKNWTTSLLSGSIRNRRRAIAAGWLMGRTRPWTGIGAGQLDEATFDVYTEEVRREARVPSPFPWKRLFFVDEEVLVAKEDKGTPNIFINALAETGVPGLLLLVGLLLILGIRSFDAITRTWRIRAVTPIAILFPLFFALLLYHQTVYLWVHPWFWTAFALTYAAARVALEAPIEASEAL